MDYKEKYNAALKRARELSKTVTGANYEYIFPELKESEGERIRKELIEFLKLPHSQFVGNREHEKWIAWLEKQGEQKTVAYAPKFRVGDIVKSKSRPMLDARKIISIDKDCYWCEDKGCIGFAWEDDYELVEQKLTDKTESFKASDWYVSKVDGKIHNIYQSVDKDEPKFKVGDWVIDNCGDTYQIETATEIESEHIFGYTIVGGGYFNDNSNVRLWTINDAKDGDVLDGPECYVMFKEFDGLNIKCYCTYHYMGFNPSFHVNTLQNKEAFHPAAKEQRDLLFHKMKEAGYEWDAERKELKKMEVPSEDEKIKKGLINYFNHHKNGINIFYGIKGDDILAWLEKQGKKLDPDKVIAWLVANICGNEYYVKLFKKDFGL